jgi:hypothetical protein
VREGGGRGLIAFVAMLGVPGGDDAAGRGTSVMGGGAVVVGVLGVEAPTTGLPERTLQLGMVWLAFIALETIWETRFTSSSFPQDGAALKGVFPWLDVGGALCCENTRHHERWWGTGAVTVKVGDEAGADSCMGKTSARS